MFLILEAIKHRYLLNHNVTLGEVDNADSETPTLYRNEVNAEEDTLQGRSHFNKALSFFF
jgi:hypothetical protein